MEKTDGAREQLTPLQKAVVLLKQAKAKLVRYESAQAEPIAIIGMACRFPGGATDPAAYWSLLCGGSDAISEVPADRWDIDRCYDPDPTVPGKMSTRWGGFLESVYDFDADFFGISPREAIRLDPQQRLLLEVAWEALQDAGLPAARVAQTRTGIFVGAIGSDHLLLQSRDRDGVDIFSGTGNSLAILANRLSYWLNVHGPSVSVDTACSSSLVTVHMACQSLRRRESHLALAGGVNLILSPETTIALSKAYMMAPDGRCKTFDERADGYVRGEGCGLVLLKRLSDAQADGDRILAVVRGTAVNHDGRSNGLTAPNGPAQEEVIRAALADARLQPGEVDYVEAHGSGTRLGDPIEMDALRSIYCGGRSAANPLLVGSVKTNIGHLESAAGIAGLIKVASMLRHSRIPPHLHVQTVNPLLKLDETPVQIPAECRGWPEDRQPRRAAVSSFGFGGTNAHAVLEEAPPLELRENRIDRPLHVVTVSARSPQALADLAGRYADALAENPETSLADFAFTANAGRDHFHHRAAIVGDSAESVGGTLAAVAGGAAPRGLHLAEAERDRQPRIAFLFTGQGSQYPGMGRTLYETQPTFRRALDRCAQLLDSQLDRPLVSLLEPESGALLDQTRNTQPVMFSLQYALAELWRSWGVEPAAVMGHSVGEFAAACVAGVFELEDGLRLISARARLMQSLPLGGSMAAVFASQGDVEAAIQPFSDQIAIAALNGPANVVVSGESDALRQCLTELERNGIRSKPLRTSHAFHSHRMEPILASLAEAASSISCHPPEVDLVANLTGRLAHGQTYTDPSYWARHARSPVRFAEGMRNLAELGCDCFLEIGPQPTLSAMGQRCLPEHQAVWLPSLRQGRDDWSTLPNSLAELYVRGQNVNWIGFDRDYARRRCPLPTYPFQRNRYWSGIAADIPPVGLTDGESCVPGGHPLLGRRLSVAVSDTVFEAQISVERPAILADHCVQGTVIMPGAAFLEMALAASAALKDEPWDVCEVSVEEPLVLDETPKTVQTVLTTESPGHASFRVVSLVADTGSQSPSQFRTHATGRLAAPSRSPEATFDIARERARFVGEGHDNAWRMEALKKSGLEPGPSFCWADRHWVADRDVLGELRAPGEEDQADGYHIHPGLIDCGFQLLGASLPGAGTGIDTYVPVGVGRLRLHDRPTGRTWCFATLKSLQAGLATGDIRLFDMNGRLLLEIESARMRQVPRNWLARLTSASPRDWLYELAWVPQPLDATSAEETSVEPGRWLIFDSRDRIGSRLAEQLGMKGHHCQLISGVVESGARREAVRTYLAEGRRSCRGVVYLTGLDIGDRSSSREPDFAAARDHGWGGVLDVVQGMDASGVTAQPHVWLVTRGAQSIPNHSGPLSLAQAPVWGLGRVIAAERPGLHCALVDIDPDDASHAVDQLVEEIWSGQRESQVAYRGGARLVARLRRLRPGRAQLLDTSLDQPYRLEITARGQLDNVVLRPLVRQTPGPGQVEIAVRATGLNFRDILNVLDLYPGDPGPLGGECAGEIVAVGEGVTNFHVGDQVLALAPACFASHVVTLAEFVQPKPAELSFTEAATIPICFATTFYALRWLGDMQPGERVLIHAATGGVGMAAIQIARQIGAEIFATAGSPRKRDHLKSLGIEHVMDSRSLDFADQIMRATAGQGVDLVLNSLTGEAIGKSLSVLRAGGRFLELGKTDLWDQSRVDAFRPGVTFHAIALDQLMAEQPETVRQLMGEVTADFVEKKLQPPPCRVYPIGQAVDAFRYMARAEHVGKIVITAADDAAGGGELQVRQDGTYLITGGLGGLGLRTARWLAELGARHLVLVGRSAPSDDARGRIDELKQAGVRVDVRACDVSRRDDAARLITEIQADGQPLRGVFHLAGVLDDGMLNEQTRERFDRVMAAKVLGGWNLHELTAACDLDLFVLFSSAAALLGSPGQSNYAAANAFLDTLAHHRRRNGRPALSVNWGSWSEVGMAARLERSQNHRWAAAGVGWIEPDHGLRTLEQLFGGDNPQAGVLPIDWPRFCEQIPTGEVPPWLAEVAAQSRATKATHAPVLLERLESVTPGEQFEVALTYIQQQAARVLGLGDGALPDPRRPLNDLGFDSLTAVELCNAVGSSIGQHLNPTLLFDYPTLESLTGYVTKDLLGLDATRGQQPAVDTDSDDDVAVREQVLQDVEGMSDEEMNRLVLQQLERLQQ